jgi:hypothetical protein
MVQHPLSNAKSPRVSTKVWFLFSNGEPLPIEIIYQNGARGKAVVQPNGVLEADADKGSYLTFEGKTPRGRINKKRIYILFDDISTPEGCWQRLLNLDYGDHQKAIDHGFEEGDLAVMVQNFQMLFDLVATAECDADTQKVLDAVMKHPETRQNLLDRSRELLPIPVQPEVRVPTIAETIALNTQQGNLKSVKIFNTVTHLPVFMPDAEALVPQTGVDLYMHQFFSSLLPMKETVTFQKTLYPELEDDDDSQSFLLSINKTSKALTERDYIDLTARFLGGYITKDGDIRYLRLCSDGVVFYWVVKGDILVELAYYNGVGEVMAINEEGWNDSIDGDPVFKVFKKWIQDNISKFQ